MLGIVQRAGATAGDVAVNTPAILSFESLAHLPWLLHGVSTRRGGVSDGHWTSLNLSFAVGDLPANVIRNRQRFTATLGIELADVVSAQ